jgi:hypothetical protein
MQTTETVEKLLTEGPYHEHIAAMALKTDVHSLIAKLQAWYQGLYGAVRLDIHDWNFIATSVKNKAVLARHEKGESDAHDAENAGAGPPADPDTEQHLLATEVADAKADKNGPPADAQVYPVET